MIKNCPVNNFNIQKSEIKEDTKEHISDAIDMDDYNERESNIIRLRDEIETQISKIYGISANTMR